MATPTTKGFLLSDNEAAAIRRWVRKQPSPGPEADAGADAVAHRLGKSRGHLQYCITPTAEKRRPVGEDILAALVGMLLPDARARYELRRVASDEVQQLMDLQQNMSKLLSHGPGFIVTFIAV